MRPATTRLVFPTPTIRSRRLIARSVGESATPWPAVHPEMGTRAAATIRTSDDTSTTGFPGPPSANQRANASTSERRDDDEVALHEPVRRGLAREERGRSEQAEGEHGGVGGEREPCAIPAGGRA